MEKKKVKESLRFFNFFYRHWLGFGLNVVRFTEGNVISTENQEKLDKAEKFTGTEKNN